MQNNTSRPDLFCDSFSTLQNWSQVFFDCGKYNATRLTTLPLRNLCSHSKDLHAYTCFEWVVSVCPTSSIPLSLHCMPRPHGHSGSTFSTQSHCTLYNKLQFYHIWKKMRFSLNLSVGLHLVQQSFCHRCRCVLLVHSEVQPHHTIVIRFVQTNTLFANSYGFTEIRFHLWMNPWVRAHIKNCCREEKHGKDLWYCRTDLNRYRTLNIHNSVQLRVTHFVSFNYVLYNYISVRPWRYLSTSDSTKLLCVTHVCCPSFLEPGPWVCARRTAAAASCACAPQQPRRSRIQPPSRLSCIVLPGDFNFFRTAWLLSVLCHPSIHFSFKRGQMTLRSCIADGLKSLTVTWNISRVQGQPASQVWWTDSNRVSRSSIDGSLRGKMSWSLDPWQSSSQNLLLSYFRSKNTVDAEQKLCQGTRKIGIWSRTRRSCSQTFESAGRLLSVCQPKWMVGKKILWDQRRFHLSSEVSKRVEKTNDVTNEFRQRQPTFVKEKGKVEIYTELLCCDCMLCWSWLFAQAKLKPQERHYSLH